MTRDIPLGALVPDWTPPAIPPRAPIQGQHVRLEPLEIERHTPDLVTAYAEDHDGAVWDYLPEGPFKTYAQVHRWVKTSAESVDPMFFAVCEAHSGKALGVLSLLRINPNAGSIEVGYITFSPSLQKTTKASEAIILMARTAFGLGYRRFEWKCNALNAGSRRAAERFGFSYEGVFRQASVIKGRNRDTAWFAMIDSEFAAIDAAYRAWLDPTNFLTSGRQIHSLSDRTRPLLVSRDPMLAT